MHKMSTSLAALIVVFSSRVPTELTVRYSRRISAICLVMTLPIEYTPVGYGGFVCGSI